jgi:hypothetical protein
MVAEDQSVVSGQDYLLVDLDQPATKEIALTLASKAHCPMIGISQRSKQNLDLSAWLDLVLQLPEEQALLEQIIQTITNQPLAAATFISVLRESANLSISQGLMMESLAYSTLQNSQGFRAWLSDRSATTSKTQTNACGVG